MNIGNNPSSPCGFSSKSTNTLLSQPFSGKIADKPPLLKDVASQGYKKNVACKPGVSIKNSNPQQGGQNALLLQDAYLAVAGAGATASPAGAA